MKAPKKPGSKRKFEGVFRTNKEKVIMKYKAHAESVH